MADRSSTTPSDGLGDRALVVGLGRSGRAAAVALADAGVTVVATDDRDDVSDVTDLVDAGIEVAIGTPATERLAGIDLVVLSPGVAETAPVVSDAAERGIPVWSEPELGWHLAPRTLVGITGTNGKTSVTELITAMLVESGLPAQSCGNIGTPFTTAAIDSDEDAVLVAELSSFQLRFCHRLRPRVGVLLNLSPDHLDWHPSVDHYAAAKARLWQAQNTDDWAVVPSDDTTCRDLARVHAPGRQALFGPRPGGGGAPGVWIENGAVVATLEGAAGFSADATTTITDIAALPLSAPHHVANVAAAACASLLIGADLDAIGAAARSYRPGRHRLEVVATADGITWVDDSKATNPHAAAAALGSYEAVVWIAGGLAKGVDLGPLRDRLSRVRHAVLLGEAAGELARICADAGVPSELARDMRDAVNRAGRAAVDGDTVLLSPACASFDQFRDYADRGDQFAAAVRATTEVTDGRS